MRDFKDLHIPGLTDEQVQRIAGGDMCSAQEWQGILDGLKQNYDTLVDFTSYVIERVATGTGG